MLIMSSPPASATTKPDACAALTPVLASRLLGARVIQAPFNHHLGCTYTSTANQDTISLILSLTGQTALARSSCSTRSSAFASGARRSIGIALLSASHDLSRQEHCQR